MHTHTHTRILSHKPQCSIYGLVHWTWISPLSGSDVSGESSYLCSLEVLAWAWVKVPACLLSQFRIWASLLGENWTLRSFAVTHCVLKPSRGGVGLHPSHQIHIINSQSWVAGCTAYKEGGLEEDLKELKMCLFRIGLEKPLGFLGLCKEFSSLKLLSLFKKLRLQICGDRIAV